MIPLPAEVAVIMALLHSISVLMQIALGVVFTVLVLTVRKRQTTSRLMVPRGYSGLPFIGFLVHFVWQKGYIQRLVRLAKENGGIFSVRMGSFDCVWLCDYEIIREAWSRPEFSGRPLVPGIVERTQGFRGGIIFNDGPTFNEEQRFVVKSLRSLGFGKKFMEDFIVTEALDIVNSLKKKAGLPFGPRHTFNLAALNVVWAVACGERYSHNDPELLHLTSILDKNMELNDGAKVAFFLPWLATIFPKMSGWKSYIAQAQEIFKFWRNVAERRMLVYQESAGPTNFVDTYIQRIQSSADTDSSFHGDHGVKSLAATLQDLFIAGTETTATTLSWFFLYMASFLDVQESIAQEISAVLGIGKGRRLPSLSDRARMPLMEATIMETMRFGTLAPLGMLHRTTEDTTLRGYFIPANTIIMSNVAAVHMSRDLWGDPQVFRPQRFLSSCGTKTIDFRYFLPFSHGKRKCIGESLARDELFIFATVILQEFSVRLEKPVKSLEPVVGVSAVPPEHRLVFQPH